MLDLPFADGSFDVVATYQALEHVPDPGRALKEMLRVARAGRDGHGRQPEPALGHDPLSGSGVLLLAEPAAKDDLPAGTRGCPDTPAGNTLPENLAALLRNGLSVLGEASRARDVRFILREPDLTPPFHADNDACYLCNPVDLVKFFRWRGCRILRCSAPGRPPLSRLVSTGTYVTAVKEGWPP